MKKFFISVALAAAVLNGVLASVGNGRISASELKVDDVEMLAEGETAIKIPKKVWKWVWKAGVWVLECIVEYCCGEEEELDGWMTDAYDSYGHKLEKQICSKVQNPNKNPDCKLGE